MKYIIILILLMVTFIYFSNSKKENYTPLLNNKFFNYLEVNGFTVDKKNKTITKENNEIISYNRYFNTKSSAYISDNKFISSSFLSDYNLPVPRFVGIDRNNYYRLNNLVDENKLKYPLVAKRVNGSFGNGIFTDIGNFNELKNITNRLLSKYSTVLVEEQGLGNSYRILIFNFKIIDVISRDKPSIIGNGEYTVKELIAIKNENLAKINKSYKIKNVNNKYLKSQGYDLNDILPEGVKIFVTNVVNMANGADNYRIDINEIPEVNKSLFIDTAQKVNIKCVGLDFLSEDIKKPYYENNGKILELNCRPDIDLHLDHEPQLNNFYDTIIKNL